MMPRSEKRRPYPALVALLVALAPISCGRLDEEVSAPVAAGSPPGPEPIELAVPAAEGSGEANLAMAEDGTALLSWLEPVDEERHALRFATLEGGAWSSPRTIVAGSDFFVNWADFPSVVPLVGGGLAAHWLARSGAGPYAYGVRVSVSQDGGASWTEPAVPHRDGTATEHGFVSLVPEPDGGVLAVWLDGRDYALHGSEEGNGPSAAETALRAARLAPDGTPGPELVLDSRICDCCQTDAARTSRGVLVVYRDRSEGEVRDISRVLVGDETGGEPDTVHDDGWEIPGCPVNGPALDAEGDEAVVAWFTLGSGEPAVNVAFSTDGGDTFAAPLRVDGGTPLGRVGLVRLGAGSAVVSWLEHTDAGAEVRLRAMSSDGAAGEPYVVAHTGAARSSGFPRLARRGEHLLIAWRDTLGVSARIRTAMLRWDALRPPPG